MIILSKRSTVFQRNSAQPAQLSQEKHFVTHLSIIVLSNKSRSIAAGINDIRFLPTSFRFGKPSRLGVTNETRRNTLVQVRTARQKTACSYPDTRFRDGISWRGNYRSHNNYGPQYTVRGISLKIRWPAPGLRC